MADKSYEKCSWVPTSPKDKTGNTVYRHGGCDLVGICRRRAQILDLSPDRGSVQECVQLLAELLADGACAGDVSCRCRDSLQDSPAVVLSPAFQVLSRRREEERRTGGAPMSPFLLLRDLFLQLDVMRHWYNVGATASWLQDLLEVCWSMLVPSPQRMCLSCRGRRGSETSSGKRHKSNTRPPLGRGSEECRHAIEVYAEHLRGPEGTAERPDQSPGLWASTQQLKNSVKKDLETHQLYLRSIETRLSGLERRAQDVGRHLERANLELEAIKQGSATLKTPVAERISSPVTEDLEEGLWAPWRRSGRRGACRRTVPSRSCARDHPAGGSTAHKRKGLRTGLSTCQRHVDVLIQQITQEINQMETDIKCTSKLRQSVG
ncbi:uncharacterized protein LOC122933284 [Bufo gargarizans]|uniref:uncharacterized protein LOC122933284 n=1 Tax=Bufo gargarizans TaxID=30331 RepID=UPI001CF2922A|nr:uncharacterized protein LOC122933284 [Bufo gargarizans]